MLAAKTDNMKLQETKLLKLYPKSQNKHRKGGNEGTGWVYAIVVLGFDNDTPKKGTRKQATPKLERPTKTIQKKNKPRHWNLTTLKSIARDERKPVSGNKDVLLKLVLKIKKKW